MQGVFSFLGYLLLTFFLLGILIFVHELGHYVAARLCKVTIHEFSLGMGKKLLSHTSKKTGIQYSLRLLPIGGYVSMAGEDEEVDDPNAFNKKNVWQRIIILVAGAGMNILVGFLAMLVMVGGMSLAGEEMYSTKIKEFTPAAPSYVTGLEEGDVILKVDGVRVHTGNDLVYEIMNSGYEAVDVLVERDGKKLLVEDVMFPVRAIGGIAFGSIDFMVEPLETNLFNVLKTSYFRSTSAIKMVFDAIGGIFTGRYSVRDLSGPIGVTTTVSDVAKGDMPVWNMLFLFSTIAMNLGVMNLMPIPALDGGRLVFRFIEVLRFGKPIDPELEARIHGTGMMLLLMLTAVIAFKDIFTLF